jgi:hypothetical protein
VLLVDIFAIPYSCLDAFTQSDSLCKCGCQILTIMTGFELKRTMRSVPREYEMAVFSYIRAQRGMVNMQWEEHVLLGARLFFVVLLSAHLKGAPQLPAQLPNIDDRREPHCPLSVQRVGTPQSQIRRNKLGSVKPLS